MSCSCLLPTLSDSLSVCVLQVFWWFFSSPRPLLYIKCVIVCMRVQCNKVNALIRMHKDGEVNAIVGCSFNFFRSSIHLLFSEIKPTKKKLKTAKIQIEKTNTNWLEKKAMRQQWEKKKVVNTSTIMITK